MNGPMLYPTVVYLVLFLPVKVFFCLIRPVVKLRSNCLFFPEREKERERVFAWVYLYI